MIDLHVLHLNGNLDLLQDVLCCLDPPRERGIYWEYDEYVSFSVISFGNELGAIFSRCQVKHAFCRSALRLWAVTCERWLRSSSLQREALHQTLQEQGILSQTATLSCTYIPTDLHTAWRYVVNMQVTGEEFALEGITQIAGAFNM